MQNWEGPISVSESTDTKLDSNPDPRDLVDGRFGLEDPWEDPLTEVSILRLSLLGIRKRRKYKDDFYPYVTLLSANFPL